MINQFRPPKTNIAPFNPIHEQRSMDMTKRAVAPLAGPITIPHLIGAPNPQAVPHPVVPNANPLQFARLKAMFAKGR